MRTDKAEHRASSPCFHVHVYLCTLSTAAHSPCAAHTRLSCNRNKFGSCNLQLAAPVRNSAWMLQVCSASRQMSSPCRKSVMKAHYRLALCIVFITNRTSTKVEGCENYYLPPPLFFPSKRKDKLFSLGTLSLSV